MMVCSLISIHALREEGDATGRHHGTAATDFYPRPPRGGRRYQNTTGANWKLFLSTPSARRATAVQRVQRTRNRNFYPRPPRGGRRYGRIKDAEAEFISIHALREEGDVQCVIDCVQLFQFLSTPSARRATLPPGDTSQHIYISIHALREEGDRRLIAQGLIPGNFYPRPPRGGRRQDRHQPHVAY